MHDSEDSKIARFVSGLRNSRYCRIIWVLFFKEVGSPSHQGEIINFEENNLLKSHNDGFYKFSWKDKNKISTKTFPSNFQKKPLRTRVSKDKPSISTPKSPTKTSSTKRFKCLGFGHIAANCPNKRTIMVKEVNKDRTKMKQKTNMKKMTKIKKRGSSPHQTWWKP